MNPAKPVKKIRTFAKLAYPTLQFLLLLSILFITSRCSPLSPSTSKTDSSELNPSIQSQSSTASDKVTQVVQDNLVKNSLTELNSADSQNILQKDFDQKTQSSLHIDAMEISDQSINAAFAQKSRSGEIMSIWPASEPLLSIPLSRDKQDALYRDAHLRVDLLSLIRDADKSHTKNLMSRLQLEIKNRNLRASAYLLFADKSTLQANAQASMHLKFSMSIIDDRTAALDIDMTTDSATNAPAIESAIRDAKQLAIIIE